MTISELAASDLSALEAFFRSLSLGMPPENLSQFSEPRRIGPGFEVATLVMKEADRIVGTIGYLDLPLLLPGSSQREIGRWPINLYLAPDQRGRGLGQRLMEATRDSKARVRLVIGGNAASIPVLEKTGWKLAGNLVSFRWGAPCLDPARLPERFRQRTRREPPSRIRLRNANDAIEARRVDPGISGRLPWVEDNPRAAPQEIGVPRDAEYLRFAFLGPLRRYHAAYIVEVNGALAGFFVLAARAARIPLLDAEIIDLDSVRGSESRVIRAARAAGLACADRVRIRISGERFTRALRDMSGGKDPAPDIPLRVSCERAQDAEDLVRLGAGAWRLTYGDHDQYRARGASQAWETSSSTAGARS